MLHNRIICHGSPRCSQWWFAVWIPDLPVEQGPSAAQDHASTFQLLVAVILSAQTTDKKVNEVTPALFADAGNAASMAALEASGHASVRLWRAPRMVAVLCCPSRPTSLTHAAARPKTCCLGRR